MKIKLREYQRNIVQSILEKGNTLVVLPTGLGKTIIAFAVMEAIEGRCVMLAPTKPLVKQHYNSWRELVGEEATIISGENRKREDLWKKRIIFATPQTMRNDMEKGIVKDISCIIIDEAHRAIGDYAYVKIAKRFKNSLIVALTASPGGKKEKIKEVIENLNIENIEIRSREDKDVKEYVKKLNIEWIKLDLGEIKKEVEMLKELLNERMNRFKKLGFKMPARKAELLALREKLLNIDHPMKFRLLSEHAIIINLNHMLELLETESVRAFNKYMEKIDKEQSNATRWIKRNLTIRKIRISLKNKEHPKMKKIVELVEKNKEKKIIIFAQYREQVKYIAEELRKRGFKAEPFMGKKEKYSKKQQEETIRKFREGEITILVASSIGEEGLDIPKVDIVIFYEPIPSEIRSIQRRGRAGRFQEGFVYILLTKGTRDEYYYWASVRKERNMKRILKGIKLKKIKKDIKIRPLKGQTTIKDFI